MYNIVGLNKNNYKFVLDLNDKRKKFNVINEDLAEYFTSINFAERILLFRRVKLLKNFESFVGYCWVNKLNRNTYQLNSIYVDEVCHPLNAYKCLVEYLGNNKKLLYNCEKNHYNFEMLRDLGFVKREGTLSMLAMVNETNFNPKDQDISFVTLQKGKHEEIRCRIQNEVFKNDSRIPLTVDDMYYDEMQSYYCEDGAVLVKYKDNFIGYGQVIFTDNIPVIVNLGILNLYRGKGYGRLLMNYLIEFLYKEGFKEVKLKVAAENKSAIKLYSSLGFKTVEESYQWEYKKE